MAPLWQLWQPDFLIFYWDLVYRSHSNPNHGWNNATASFPHWLSEDPSRIQFQLPTLITDLKMNALLAFLSSLSQISISLRVFTDLKSYLDWNLCVRLDLERTQNKAPVLTPYPSWTVLFHCVATFPVRSFTSHSIWIICWFVLIFYPAFWSWELWFSSPYLDPRNGWPIDSPYKGCWMSAKFFQLCCFYDLLRYKLWHFFSHISYPSFPLPSPSPQLRLLSFFFHKLL